MCIRDSPVSAPFHSRLMEPAALRLKEELDKIQVSDAQIPVVANVTGKILTNANDIKESLVTQAANPVLWEDCVAEMVNFGVTRFVEVGPGKVLTGFTKKINKDMELANVEDIASCLLYTSINSKCHYFIVRLFYKMVTHFYFL